MLSKLSRDERLRLMKFVCSFAWADLEVQDEERHFVGKLVRRLGLDDQGQAQVRSWLEVPPLPEEVDPADVPADQREFLLETVRGLIAADHVVDSNERENLQLLEELLR